MCTSVTQGKIYGGTKDSEHVLLMTDSQHLNFSRNDGTKGSGFVPLVADSCQFCFCKNGGTHDNRHNTANNWFLK
jgi:hypothetical protein